VTRRCVGRYILGELVGGSAYVEVFAACAVGEHGFQKPVALHRLHDRSAVRGLLGRAQLLVGMHHGNLIGMLDLACDGNDVYVVTELVDAPSVRDVLDVHGPLSPGLALYIVRCAAAGLAYAHARGVVHGDLDATSIMLTRAGEVRVADVGIAGRPAAPSDDVRALAATLDELLAHARLPRELAAVCARARAGAIAMPELVAGLVAIAFAMQWREGARELAAVVGERAHAEQTEVTARPVTLVAQSLMLDTPTLAWVRPPPAPPRERAPSVLDVISGVEPRVLAVLAWSAVAGMFAGILLP